jgi:hypothetical protein
MHNCALTCNDHHGCWTVRCCVWVGSTCNAREASFATSKPTHPQKTMHGSTHQWTRPSTITLVNYVNPSLHYLYECLSLLRRHRTIDEVSEAVRDVGWVPRNHDCLKLRRKNILNYDYTILCIYAYAPGWSQHTCRHASGDIKEWCCNYTAQSLLARLLALSLSQSARFYSVETKEGHLLSQVHCLVY